MKTLICLLAALAVPAFAAPPDPRLATVRQAWITAADPLSDDQRVASCVSDWLAQLTPLSAVSDKAQADVILTVSGASVGKHPKALISATLPDGTKIWDGKSKTRGFNLAGRKMTCVIAEDLIESLRNADEKDAGWEIARRADGRSVDA
jgi:hypothetical protein